MLKQGNRVCCWPPSRATPLLGRLGLGRKGLISIIVTDPANPYWLTEGNVAEATAEEARLHRHRRRATRATPTPRAT